MDAGVLNGADSIFDICGIRNTTQAHMLNTILAADRKRVTCGATTVIKKSQPPDKRPPNFWRYYTKF